MAYIWYLSSMPITLKRIYIVKNLLGKISMGKNKWRKKKPL